jgi:hypothetical protein
MLSFQRLDVYQVAVEFLSFAHGISSEASRGNAPMFDQLKRAATSIPLNIGEAAGRTGTADVAAPTPSLADQPWSVPPSSMPSRRSRSLPAEPYARGIQLVERMVAMPTKLCR